MDTQDGRDGGTVEQLERTSVLLRPDTMEALRQLAKEGNRPLSREIRQALESYVKDARSAA